MKTHTKECRECHQTFEVTDKDFKQERYLFGGDSISSSYICYDCYAKLWDEGFEASMDYSDAMLEKEKQDDQ